MANEYASAAELKATLELTGETYADGDIDLALTAASRGIDKATRRRFYPDADADQVRYYTPEGCDLLYVDDIIEVASVKTDPGGDSTFPETWTANTDYVLEPLNAAADEEPWTAIRAHPLGNYRFPDCYPRSVQVTAMFGWETVPDGVKAATIIIAAKLVRRAREATFGVIALGLDGAAVQIARHDPEVTFLLGPYMRNRIVVA